MPDKTILPVLSAYLWDLRAQCESQLRALTLAQRLVDAYRDAETDAERAHARADLQQDLAQIVKANAAIRESAEEVVRQADLLPDRLN